MSARPGYMGQIARVDLSTGATSYIPTETYAGAFIGGRGMATKIYWDEVSPQTKAFDPENRLIFATGPCCGIPGLAGARWEVCGKSPSSNPEVFTYSNLGGSWGAALKFAGFDGLVVQGRAEASVYLVVRDGRIEVRDASALRGQGAARVREALKRELGTAYRVVATGPAGDNQAVMATLLAENDSSGSGGLGGVMGSKNLKAIAVRGQGRVQPAHPDRLESLLDHVAQLKGRSRRQMGDGAEANPVKKYRCHGCTTEGCMRGIYRSKDGTQGKFMCQSSHFYTEWVKQHYSEPNEVPFYANRLCDDYGLSTMAVAPIVTWLYRCYQAGLVTEESTGLPLGKIGSLEFIQALTRSMSFREGFGDLLAQGLPRAAEAVGRPAVELLADEVNKAQDRLTYGKRLSYAPEAYITTALLYAVEVRLPVQQLHEVGRLAIEWARWATGQPGANLSSEVFRAIGERFWGSAVAADFSTYEGKALAAKMIQDRELAKESLILCDIAFPVLYADGSPDHVGDPSLESQILSAVTGRDLTTEELYSIGERLVNLQRATLVREGHHGIQSDTLPEICYTLPLDSARANPDCLVPGKGGQPFSRKGAVLDRGGFRKMLDEFYQLRGWDQETGLQRRALLEGLGLEDVAQDLASRGLLSP